MANATFGSWSSFTTNTSTAFPKYYVVRGDGFLGTAMGMTATGYVSCVYTPSDGTYSPAENIIVSGLGADAWFSGAIEVITFSA